MSYELSSRTRPQFRLTAILITHGFLLLCLVLLAIVGGRSVQARLQLTAASRAQAATWNVSAPACPTMSRAGFATFHNYAPLGINLWDTQIERRAGEVSCTLVSPSLWDGQDFMSCRFSHPIFLRIVRDGRETFFRTGDRPATLRLDQDGAVQCRAG